MRLRTRRRKIPVPKQIGLDKEATKVKEIPEEFSFVNVDTEVESIKALLGDKAREFDSFFIRTENGEIIEAYGMHGTTPHDDRPVYKIL